MTKEQVYLDWALKIYQWQKETLVDQTTGAVYDNINGESGAVDKTALTYNQGTFLGTATELYAITGDALYIVDGQKIANYTITKCIDGGNNVLRNEGDGDGALFKGIFIRYFVQFLEQDGIAPAYRTKFESFLKNNAKVAWTKGTNPLVLLFGSSWSEIPVGETQLTAQTSAAMLFESIAKYDKN